MCIYTNDVINEFFPLYPMWLDLTPWIHTNIHNHNKSHYTRSPSRIRTVYYWNPLTRLVRSKGKIILIATLPRGGCCMEQRDFSSLSLSPMPSTISHEGDFDDDDDSETPPPPMGNGCVICLSAKPFRLPLSKCGDALSTARLANWKGGRLTLAIMDGGADEDGTQGERLAKDPDQESIKHADGYKPL